MIVKCCVENTLTELKHVCTNLYSLIRQTSCILYELMAIVCVRKMLVAILISHIFLIALRIAHVSATGSKLTIHEIICDLQPNDYVKDCKAWTEDNSAFLNATFSQKAVSELIIGYTITLGQGEIPEQTISLCVAIQDDTIKKKFIRYIQPREQFPDDCSMWTEGTWLMDKYCPEPEDIPPYSTDGKVTADIYLSEADGDPFLWVHGEGELTPIVGPASVPF